MTCRVAPIGVHFSQKVLKFAPVEPLHHVILSEAKDLSLGIAEILRFAQSLP